MRIRQCRGEIRRTLQLVLSTVLVQILLLDLALDISVVTELAFGALLAVACFEKSAEESLRIDAKRNLLRLHRFEQSGLVLQTFLFLCFLFRSKSLLLLLFQSVARFACQGLLLLDTSDLLLDLGRFVFLASK